MYQVCQIPYYDSVHQCYKQIITIHPQPQGALLQITRRIPPSKLSPFKHYSQCSIYPQCFYAVMNPTRPCDFLTVEELPLFFGFLSKEGYSIDNQLTKLMMKANTQIKNTLLFYIIEINNS